MLVKLILEKKKCIKRKNLGNFNFYIIRMALSRKKYKRKIKKSQIAVLKLIVNIKKKIYKKKKFLKIREKCINFFLFLHTREVFFFNKFVNCLMYSGKKDKAIFIFISLIYCFHSILLKYKYKYVTLYKYYDKFYKNIIQKQKLNNPFFFLVTSLNMSRVIVNIKKKKIGSKVEQIPIFVNKIFFEGSCFRLLINCARSRIDTNILLKLIYEIISLIKLDVSSLVWKKKKNIYLLALSNKFYIKNL